MGLWGCDGHCCCRCVPRHSLCTNGGKTCWVEQCGETAWLVQACREERHIFLCIFVNRTYVCFYNKWPNQGLYNRNYWTLPCVTTQSFHHTFNCSLLIFIASNYGFGSSWIVLNIMNIMHHERNWEYNVETTSSTCSIKVYHNTCKPIHITDGALYKAVQGKDQT